MLDQFGGNARKLRQEVTKLLGNTQNRHSLNVLKKAYLTMLIAIMRFKTMFVFGFGLILRLELCWRFNLCLAHKCTTPGYDRVLRGVPLFKNTVVILLKFSFINS